MEMQDMRMLDVSRGAARAVVALAVLVLAGAVHAQGLMGLFGPPAGEPDAFMARGCEVRVEKYEPACPGVYPAVLVLYGSDGMGKFKAQYRMVGSELAKNGYVALIVHYFDLGGEPEDPENPKFTEAQFHAWERAVKAGITHAQRMPNVNPNRIGVVGFSLGSFVGLSVAAQDTRVKAVVDSFGGLPEPYARNLKHMPPTLIVHGEQDEYVSVTEARKLAALLKSKGVPHEVHIFPCEGHTLGREAAKEAADLGLSFLNRHLK
jgi:carboxymethylenebutenolidase